MLYIKKNSEPQSLTNYRCQKGAYFDGYAQKNDVKSSLLEEQKYLCAYCMTRINDIDKSTIEHWQPQSTLTDISSLDYQNMLGVCLGNRNQPLRMQTCDAHRGNQKITVNPQNKNHMDNIKYLADGTIYSDNVEINHDLNEVLNLNYPQGFLLKNRKNELDAVKRKLTKEQPDGIWSKSLLLRIQNEYTRCDNNRQKPYAGIVLYFIEKWLKKAK